MDEEQNEISESCVLRHSKKEKEFKRIIPTCIRNAFVSFFAVIIEESSESNDNEEDQQGGTYNQPQYIEILRDLSIILDRNSYLLYYSKLQFKYYLLSMCISYKMKFGFAFFKKIFEKDFINQSKYFFPTIQQTFLQLLAMIISHQVPDDFYQCESCQIENNIIDELDEIIRIEEGKKLFCDEEQIFIKTLFINSFMEVDHSLIESLKLLDSKFHEFRIFEEALSFYQQKVDSFNKSSHSIPRDTKIQNSFLTTYLNKREGNSTSLVDINYYPHEQNIQMKLGIFVDNSICRQNRPHKSFISVNTRVTSPIVTNSCCNLCNLNLTNSNPVNEMKNQNISGISKSKFRYHECTYRNISNLDFMKEFDKITYLENLLLKLMFNQQVNTANRDITSSILESCIAQILFPHTSINFVCKATNRFINMVFDRFEQMISSKVASNMSISKMRFLFSQNIRPCIESVYNELLSPREIFKNSIPVTRPISNRHLLINFIRNHEYISICPSIYSFLRLYERIPLASYLLTFAPYVLESQSMINEDISAGDHVIDDTDFTHQWHDICKIVAQDLLPDDVFSQLDIMINNSIIKYKDLFLSDPCTSPVIYVMTACSIAQNQFISILDDNYHLQVSEINDSEMAEHHVVDVDQIFRHLMYVISPDIKNDGTIDFCKEHEKQFIEELNSLTYHYIMHKSLCVASQIESFGDSVMSIFKKRIGSAPLSSIQKDQLEEQICSTKKQAGLIQVFYRLMSHVIGNINENTSEIGKSSIRAYVENLKIKKEKNITNIFEMLSFEQDAYDAFLLTKRNESQDEFIITHIPSIIEFISSHI